MSLLAAGGAAATRLAFLADDTDVGDETHKAGPIAVLVIVVLCIACFVLFRSMTKHMRRVREEFPTDETIADEALGGGAPASADVPAGPVADPTAAAAPGTSRNTPKTRSHTPDS